VGARACPAAGPPPPPPALAACLAHAPAGNSVGLCCCACGSMCRNSGRALTGTRVSLGHCYPPGHAMDAVSLLGLHGLLLAERGRLRAHQPAVRQRDARPARS